jgi:ubiquinone/menaquinone biosynthesis C-methylase UbiE
MLTEGRNRMLDAGVLLPVALCDGEKLPFNDNRFDVVTVAFGLRNMTHKDKALEEMRRVTRPGWKGDGPRVFPRMGAARAALRCLLIQRAAVARQADCG